MTAALVWIPSGSGECCDFDNRMLTCQAAHQAGADFESGVNSVSSAGSDVVDLLFDIAKRCCDCEPTRRPTAADVLEELLDARSVALLFESLLRISCVFGDNRQARHVSDLQARSEQWRVANLGLRAAFLCCTSRGDCSAHTGFGQGSG